MALVISIVEPTNDGCRGADEFGQVSLAETVALLNAVSLRATLSFVRAFSKVASRRGLPA
jgi:hypothetical protein